MDAERRRNNDGRLDEVIKILNDSIAESREYRAADKVRQEFIKEQVAKTNGRVTDLENWQKEIKTKIADRKESKESNISLLSVICTVIMAVSAIVVCLKH